MKKFLYFFICTLILISTFGISQHEVSAKTTSKSYMMNKKYTYKYKVSYIGISTTDYINYKYNSKTKYWQEGTKYTKYKDAFKEVFNSKGLYRHQLVVSNKTPQILPKYIKKGSKWSYSFVLAGGTVKESFKITSLKGHIGEYKNCVVVKNTEYMIPPEDSGEKTTKSYSYLYYAKGIGLVYEKAQRERIYLLSKK